MDESIIIAILGILFIISICFNIIFYISLKNMRKREKSRMKRIDQVGAPVYATVTRVIHQKRQTNYVVQAQWLSRETGRVYKFEDSCRFRRGILGFRPKINKGDTVPVNVIFNEPMYRIKRK